MKYDARRLGRGKKPAKPPGNIGAWGFQPKRSVEFDLEVDGFHLTTPNIFHAEAEQGVLAVKAIHSGFRDSRKPQVNEEVISEHIAFQVDAATWGFRSGRRVALMRPGYLHRLSGPC